MVVAEVKDKTLGGDELAQVASTVKSAIAASHGVHAHEVRVCAPQPSSMPHFDSRLDTSAEFDAAF